MGIGEFNTGGQPCDGLASHPGGSRNNPGHYIATDTGYKGWPDKPLGPCADRCDSRGIPWYSTQKCCIL